MSAPPTLLAALADVAVELPAPVIDQVAAALRTAPPGRGARCWPARSRPPARPMPGIPWPG